MEESGGWSRGRCRLEQVDGGLAPVEGAMEEPRGRSKGRCRLGQVQGGSAPGEIPSQSQEVGLGAGAGLDKYSTGWFNT